MSVKAFFLELIISRGADICAGTPARVRHAQEIIADVEGSIFCQCIFQSQLCLIGEGEGGIAQIVSAVVVGENGGCPAGSDSDVSRPWAPDRYLVDGVHQERYRIGVGTLAKGTQ